MHAERVSKGTSTFSQNKDSSYKERQTSDWIYLGANKLEDFSIKDA